MSQNKSKAFLLQKFLDFVRAHIPLTEVTIATLGGLGLEASIWEENGILPGNGWLIERNVNLGKSLIRNSNYRSHNSLETISSVVSGVYGTDGGLDALHLDLCGTLESRVHVINPLLVLLRKGRARCLAITVTEQRRNKTLQNWTQVEEWLMKHFNKDIFEKIFETLEAEQILAPRCSDDRESINRSVQREFGVIRLMLEGLATVKMFPKLVQRYGYISGTNTRMRTYILHLAELPLLQPDASQALGINFFKSWTANPIIWISKKGEQNTLSPASFPPVVKEENTITVMDNTNGIREKIPNLLTLTAHMSKEVKDEVELLIKAAEEVPTDYEDMKVRVKSLEDLFLQIHGISNEALGKATSGDVESTVPNETVARPQPQNKKTANAASAKKAGGKPVGDKKTKGSTKPKVGKKMTAKKAKELEAEIKKLPPSEAKVELKTDGFSDEVAEMVGLMEIEAINPELTEAARFSVAKNLGLNPREELVRRQFGGKVARTRGKFFPNYIKRITAEMEQTQRLNFAAIVAPVAAKLFDKPVSANDLMNLM